MGSEPTTGQVGVGSERKPPIRFRVFGEECGPLDAVRKMVAAHPGVTVPEVKRLLEPLALDGDRAAVRRSLNYAARWSGAVKRDHEGRLTPRAPASSSPPGETTTEVERGG